MSTIDTNISAYSSGTAHGMGPRKRPDPTEMAENLFANLDTKNQGYIDKSDLTSALGKLSGDSSSSSEADEIFSKLDGDGDGKITKQELSDTLTKLADELHNQAHSSRMGGMGKMEGMPPPPPPPGEDEGLTKDQLSEMADSMSSDNSQAASDLQNLIASFDKADTNQDGKITMQEKMAFDKSSSNNQDGSSQKMQQQDAHMMMKMMQLLHAYGNDNQQSTSASASISAVV